MVAKRGVIFRGEGVCEVGLAELWRERAIEEPVTITFRRFKGRSGVFVSIEGKGACEMGLVVGGDGRDEEGSCAMSIPVIEDE